MKDMQTDKCKLCEIISNPKLCSWVFRDSPLCLICSIEPHRIMCIYKKHGSQPGGHKINEMVELMLKIKEEGEHLEYYDGEHFFIAIETKKGEQ